MVEELKKNCNIKDMLTEASPYKIITQEGETKVEYTGELQNIERQRGQICVFDQKHMIEKLFYLGEHSEDKIELIIDSQYWEYFGNNARIAIYKVGKDEPSQITFKISEVIWNSILPHSTSKRFALFNEIYSQFDPSKESGKERAELDEIGQNKTEFTYGEILYQHFLPLLKLAQPEEGQVFWDIGCGGAKPIAVAALEFPYLKKCMGVEFLPSLCTKAKEYMSTLQTLVNSTDEKIAPIEIIEGDLLEIDWWNQADIVYSSSVCFPQFLNQGIAT